MFRKSFFIILTLASLGCKREISYSTQPLNKSGKTISERIPAPEGFKWMEEKEDSFGYFLKNLPLKEDGAEVLDYQNQPIYNQSGHAAIIDLEIGTKDLQQCADAVIRLRSDYLWKHKRFDEIGFHFTSGHFFKWNDYKNGIRAQVTPNNQVNFVESANYDDSLENYRKYLELIFMYAGTISQNKETQQITKDKEIETGNIIITPGSPGHVVIIVGRAENKKGEKVYLLAQGYTPAQSIHVLNNQENPELNPWYSFSTDDQSIQTSGYFFDQSTIRKYK